MKAFNYRITLTVILLGFLGLYGWMIHGANPPWGSHPSWSIAKWAAICLATGAIAVALETILGWLVGPLAAKDKVTDPLWKRSIRAAGLILVLGSLILIIAVYKIWAAP